MTISPFVEKPIEFEKLQSSPVYKAYALLEEKGSYDKLTKEEKEQVIAHFRESWQMDAYRYGVYKLGGWRIDFRKFMKRFVVKFKHYGWLEITSFNRTTIRNNCSTPSYVLEILDRDKSE